MTDEEIKSYINTLKSRISITKTVATRTVKTQKGDFFVGFSAAWDTVQEDGAQGLESLMDEGDDVRSGMSLEDAKIAQYMLAMQADVAAYEAALANGAISSSVYQDTVKAVRAGYMRMIRNSLSKQNPHVNEQPTENG